MRHMMKGSLARTALLVAEMASKSGLKSCWAILTGVLTFFLVLPTNATPTLIGDPVECSQIGGSTYYSCDPKSNVVGPGLEFVIGFGPNLEFFNIDISANTISILASREDSDAPLQDLSDVIVRISDLDWIGSPDRIITDATLTFNDDVSEFMQEDISFTADSVSIILGEASDSGGSTTWINNQLIMITLETSVVPAPAAMQLLGFGLVGLLGIRRKMQ